MHAKKRQTFLSLDLKLDKVEKLKSSHNDVSNNLLLQIILLITNSFTFYHRCDLLTTNLRLITKIEGMKTGKKKPKTILNKLKHFGQVC